MAGGFISIDVNAQPVIDALQRLTDAGRDLRPAMRDIGEHLTNTTRHRIESGGPAPDGTPWAVPRRRGDQPLMPYVGAKTQLVRLSAETAGKQAARHPDLLPADYAAVDELLATGEVLREDAKTVVVFGGTDEAPLRAVLKRTGKHDRELFLTTYHRDKAGRKEKARETLTRLRASR